MAPHTYTMLAGESKIQHSIDVWYTPLIMLVHTGAKQNSFGFKGSWSYWNAAGSGKSLVFLSFLLTVCISRNQFTSGVTVIVEQVLYVNNVSWREIPYSRPAMPGNTLWVTTADVGWCRVAVGWYKVKWRTWADGCCTRWPTLLPCAHTAFVRYKMWKHRELSHDMVLQAQRNAWSSNNGKVWQRVQQACGWLTSWSSSSHGKHFKRRTFGWHLRTLCVQTSEQQCTKSVIHHGDFILIEVRLRAANSAGDSSSFYK